MISLFKRAPTKRQLLFIRNTFFLVCLTPLLRLVFLGFEDHLTANPVEFVERSTGFWTLFTLLVTLTISPVRLLIGVAWPIQLRRMIGLFMFFYACLHITTYLWLDHSFFWPDISHDILKHPYVLVGLTAFVLTIPLALSSTNSMMKRLGGRWKKLHRLIYIIAILGIVHFWWLVKKDIREPLFYGSFLFTLLVIRIHFGLPRFQ